MPVKTVAIVGSHTGSREDAPWTRKYVDIWLFNEAASIGWPRRVNAIFQMHDPAVWKNPLNRNDGNYHKWLTEAHPYPVYMLEEFAGVPASVAYPLDAVCAELLPGLYRGRDRKKRIRAYFTSSVAYAVALALYQGYQRIELYGVEMESDTEYTYQRDGVFFWLGVAQGRGVEVIVHPRSGFFTEPLYGYGGGVSLQRSDFEERVKLLEGYAASTLTEVKQAEAELVAQLERIHRTGKTEPDGNKKFFAAIRAQTQAVIDHNSILGALAEAERYMHKADVMDEHGGQHIFARQEFEITASQVSTPIDQFRAGLSVTGGEATAVWNQMQKNIEKGLDVEPEAERYFQVHDQYLRRAAEFGRLTGIQNENVHYLGLVDKLVKAAGGVKSEEAILASLNGHAARVEVADAAPVV